MEVTLNKAICGSLYSSLTSVPGTLTLSHEGEV